MEYSLSGYDMQRWLPEANIMTYTELSHSFARGQTIFDVMGPGKTLVLLYLTRERHGHWTLVFERPDGSIEAFDSFGYLPDDQLNFISKRFQRESNQNHTYLLKLLANSGRPIHYNKDPLQICSPHINTCGRHCIVRVAFRNMPIEQYVKMMCSTSATPDEIVVKATQKYLPSL